MAEKESRNDYQRRHRAVRLARGKAAEQICVECGKNAAHWATIHGTDGSSPQHYQPMCAGCHFEYDDHWTEEQRAKVSVARKKYWAELSPEERERLRKLSSVSGKKAARIGLKELMARVVVGLSGECHSWNGYHNPNGYAMKNAVSDGEGSVLRWLWVLRNGSIPGGKIVRSSCGNKGCVNVDHAVCENNGERNLSKEQCPAGHAYEGENLIIEVTGSRGCRECRNTHRRERRAGLR